MKRSILLIAFWFAGAAAGGEFRLAFGPGGITSLKRAGDEFATEFVAPGHSLGSLVIRWRKGDGPWREAAVRPARWLDESGARAVSVALANGALDVKERFALGDAALRWTLAFENKGSEPIEIGDVAIPLPMNTIYPKITSERVKEEIFKRRVFRHSFVSGHGSFVFWLPVGGVGSFLVMTPLDGTKLEYFTEHKSGYAHGGTTYTVYIHSLATGGSERRGTWRQPHTSLVLRPGQRESYGFAFRWADDYEGVREVLYRSGGFDVHVAPGMVLPVGMEARFALRTRNKISAVIPEFPDQTRLRHLREKAPDTHIYSVRFERLGENMLTVRWGDGNAMFLEFFVTEPLETLIKKRAAFIATRQQHRDPAKWYDGLFSLWDVRLPPGKNLLGPDNLGGQHPYAVSGSDDPSNSKCIYLAEKNAVYPEPREVEALEYFIEHFVWGKHQRTDKEFPYPYGIYGSDSWFANRFARRDPLEQGISRPGGPSQCRMWRTFDYTTYFALYYDMYRIAKRHPGLCHYLDAAGYRERAFGTARAFFEVPYNIRMEGGWAFTGWTDWAYKIGNFHEKYLLKIIAALEREGQKAKADYLRSQWEKKVKFFIYDDPYPFISEMPVDSTAYESCYAIARYALTHGLKPDERLWHDKNTGRWYSHPRIDPQCHRAFLHRQLAANLACRGWLETAYYHLGSDFRGCGSSFYCLSYMSQMGGWAILDQALNFERDPAPLVRLGYAAMLSSWALVNSGFWHPGKRHDGAVGWGFMPQKFAADWNPATTGIPRGPWPVDGEIDHGLAAYVETAATVVLDDPLFGLFAFGGELRERADAIEVVPRDGVRRRLWVVRSGRRVLLGLDGDGFARGRPITIANDFTRIAFELENRARSDHTTEVVLRGLPPALYRLGVEGAEEQSADLRRARRARAALTVPGDAKTLKVNIVREHDE